MFTKDKRVWVKISKAQLLLFLEHYNIMLTTNSETMTNMLVN